MDDADRKILAELQRNADISVQELAERIGLSATPTARRLRLLRERGVVKTTVALLDADALGLEVTIFAFVKTSRHDGDWLAAFADGVRNMPEVVEFYRLSGDVDYLIKIVLPSMKDYDGFYKRLIKTAPLSDVSSSFAMEVIKNTTELPLALVG